MIHGSTYFGPQKSQVTDQNSASPPLCEENSATKLETFSILDWFPSAYSIV